MANICQHCGYSSLAHRQVTVYSSLVIQAAIHRDIQEWSGNANRHLADRPCDNYKRDNLLYLESLVTNNG